MSKFWKIAGPVFGLVLLVAWFASGALRRMEATAKAAENMAESIEHVAEVAEMLDSTEIDTDSIRATGMRLGGALGSSIRAIADSAKARNR